MDIVGSTSAAIALAETALKVIKYIRAVAGANESRQKLLQEIAQIRGLALTLKDLSETTVDDVWRTALKDANEPLAAFESLMNDMLVALGGSEYPVIAQSNVEPIEQLHSGTVSGRFKNKFIQVANNTKNLAWPYTEHKVKNMLTTLERIKASTLLALSCDSMHLSMKIHQNLLEVVSNSQEALSILLDTKSVDLTQWTDEQGRLFGALSSLDLTLQESSVLEEDLRKYSTWILNHSNFTNWLTTGGSMVLVGPPGSGKTTVLRAVESSLRSIENVFVVVLNFDLPRMAQPNLQEILANIVTRMMQQKRQFQKYYNKLMLTGEGPLDVESSLRFIHRARQDFHNVYILLEAVDTWDEQELRTFITKVSNLRAPLRIFATSRDRSHELIYDVFQHRIDMKLHDTMADIREYIWGWFKTHDVPRFEILDDAGKNRIVEILADSSKGLFSYATVLLEELASTRTHIDAFAAVAQRASALWELYGNLISQIKEERAEIVDLARETLSLLIREGNSTDVVKLLASIPQWPAGLAPATDDEKIDSCISACQQLVIRDGNHVRLVHVSARDYLVTQCTDWLLHG